MPIKIRLKAALGCLSLSLLVLAPACDDSGQPLPPALSLSYTHHLSTADELAFTINQQSGTSTAFCLGSGRLASGATPATSVPLTSAAIQQLRSWFTPDLLARYQVDESVLGPDAGVSAGLVTIAYAERQQPTGSLSIQKDEASLSADTRQLVTNLDAFGAQNCQ
jgi:hypothetical protein